MHLTPEDIAEFQRLWKQETGQNITPETAKEYAEDILGLVQLAIKV